MNLTIPVPITPSNFVSSTVGEPAAGESNWNSGTTYALGDRVIRTSTHKVYESLQASNTNHTPETSDTWWVEVGPTARWAMFDESVGTITSIASPLTVVVQPGAINAIALLELAGTAWSVSITSGGSPVYSASGDLDGTIIGDWYAYWFEPYAPKTAITLTDIPPFGNAVVTVTITGPGTVSCGNAVFGTVYDIGQLEAGAKYGILDFSRKERNQFGAYEVVQREFAKTLSGDVWFENTNFDLLASLFASIRATPCVWEAVPGDGRFTSLILYGIYTSFAFDTRHPTHSINNLAIESYI